MYIVTTKTQKKVSVRTTASSSISVISPERPLVSRRCVQPSPSSARDVELLAGPAACTVPRLAHQQLAAALPPPAMSSSMRPAAGSEAPEFPFSRPRSRGEASEPPDLISGLWQEATFARLPDDAPPKLQDFVRDIDNPRRVYAIHKASRRHDFQLLVDRYVFQLRNGCGAPKCSTSTCFTSRKRLVGKAPIWRFNPTSARTLAIFLASRESPETGLCSYLQRSKEPSAAFNTVVFSARINTSPQAPKPPNDASLPAVAAPRDCPKSANASTATLRLLTTSKHQVDEADASRRAIHDRPVSKDYRSFAAAAFGTLAVKMLEWLTPQGLEYMSRELFDGGRSKRPLGEAKESPATVTESRPSLQAAGPQSSVQASHTHAASVDATRQDGERTPPTVVQPPDTTAPLPKIGSKHTRGSRGSFRAPSSPSLKRRGSHESPIVSSTKDEANNKLPPKSATLNPYLLDKRSRTSKISSNVMTRNFPAIPTIPLKPTLYDGVPCLFSPTVQNAKAADQLSCLADDETNTSGFAASPRDSQAASSGRMDLHDSTSEHESWQVECPLPQSLRLLNVELVDFICDVFQEDNTVENQDPEPLRASEAFPIPQNRQAKLTRRKRAGLSVDRAQWKAFNEQTIFDVLSNPRSLVQSFTQDGKLYDSQTVWYCMARMTRAAPSLVLHSLWLVARNLFAPPESLLNMRTQRKRILDGGLGSLSDFDAGCILSVCLHALVAAVPYVSDSKSLFEMSRIRSHGWVLSTAGKSRQPPSTCLDYDEAFSNELALRLARRLFSAITARKCFAEIADCDSGHASDSGCEFDVLRPLLSQLELMSSEPIRILEFIPAERLVHETRVPTLLLDWARATLLDDWDGRSEFSGDSPLHGALSLMTTLYEHRNMLLLGDVQFRVYSLAARLDAMEMPVAWLAFTSTRQRCHLLDYPYLFSPEALVDYFRSINFARMVRAYEESASLKSRMSAIINPGSVLTDPHQKDVLQQLLKTASARFLVLEVGRNSVVRDAFDQLWKRQERELLRPLKIHLGEDDGETGFDSGGVQQEFFRLAIAECMDPKYGAFQIDDRTRAAWFVPGSLVEEWKFEMIGLLMSLAVYNGLTLPVTFPKALYRKLLGQKVDQLYDIADGWPQLASGLTKLLELEEKDGLVEDVFARTYEFSVSMLGSNVTRQMNKPDSAWPQGIPSEQSVTSETAEETSEAPLVTNANRDEYVSDYIRYLTDVSIRPQYMAFERGFRACLEPKSLSLLTPPILQSLVEGVQEIDIAELRRHVRYVGWDHHHRTVRDFWSIVKKYDGRMKRKLLEFVTASDRVPVGGMKNLQFVVQKNGEEEGEDGHLPTAYTCYGTLLLPVYRDKYVLRERLNMALQNSQGFGFA